jgi:hypothetical protein
MNANPEPPEEVVDQFVRSHPGDAALAHEIAFLLRERLVGEIVLEEREGIAETHGVESVMH